MTDSAKAHQSRRATGSAPVGTRLTMSVLRARHQAGCLGLFGVLGVVAAARHVQGDWSVGAVGSPDGGRQGLMFLLGAGTVVGAVAWFRSARRMSRVAPDHPSDGGLYIGFLLGAVVAAALLVGGRPDEWVLSGLLISVALFMLAMARLEGSAVGVTAALSLAVIAAFVGMAQMSTWVIAGLSTFSVMLIAAGFAVSGEQAGT